MSFFDKTTFSQRCFFFTWLLVIGCSGRDKQAGTQPADSATTTRQPGQSRVMEPPAPQSESVGKSTGTITDTNRWHYDESVDEEGKPVFKASVTSPDRLEFDFPYNGGSTATLTIRKRVSGTNVYIQVSKGQFNRSFQGGSARVRFDQRPPVNYTFSAAANGSANVIFFDADRVLIDRMKTARTMRVDVEFAGQDKRQITFQTAGLRWNH